MGGEFESDEDLVDSVRNAQRGQPEAVERLARHACRLALRTSMALIGDREEARDVSQDVSVDVLRSLDRLREPGAFDGWVHRITVRRVQRRLRVRRLTHRTETPLALMPEPSPPAGSAGHPHPELVEIRQALAAALAGLPERQRIAIALRYVHDLSDAEIADALDCREGTVHALLSRARDSLRTSEHLTCLAPEPTGGTP